MSGPFTLQLQALVKKYKANMHIVVRKTLIDLGTAVIYRSPVGDPKLWSYPAPPGYVGGHFRANWHYTTGVPAEGVRDTLDAAGGATLDAIRVGIPEQAAGLVHFITNNVPYGPMLEWHSHSKQAPLGIVGITITEFQSFVDKNVAELKI